MSSAFAHRSPLVVRIASFAALGGGAFLLVADSAECPDGYVESRFAASFVSSCPAGVGPREGTVAITVPGGDGTSQDTSIVEGLRTAGFIVDEATSRTGNAGDVCTTAGFSFRRTSGDVRFTCSDLRFDASRQEVKCSGQALTPLALSFGRRNVTDGAAEDFGDAGDAGDAADEGDGASDGGESEADSGIGKPAPSARPAPGFGASQPIDCAITFTKSES